MKTKIDKLTREELVIIARELRIKKASSLNKGQLVDTILSNDSHQIKSVLKITWWDKYHYYVFGWASVAGVVLTIIFYFSPFTYTESTTLETGQSAIEDLTTSDSHRKNLAQLGISWNVENFLELIRIGDLKSVELFLAGGMPANVEGGDRPMPIMLSANMRNPTAMLGLLKKFGLDVNHRFRSNVITGPQTYKLLTWAILKDNRELVNALINNGVDVASELETFGSDGNVRLVTPVELAIEVANQEKIDDGVVRMLIQAAR